MSSYDSSGPLELIPTAAFDTIQRYVTSIVEAIRLCALNLIFTIWMAIIYGLPSFLVPLVAQCSKGWASRDQAKLEIGFGSTREGAQGRHIDILHQPKTSSGEAGRLSSCVPTPLHPSVQFLSGKQTHRRCDGGRSAWARLSIF